MEGEIHIPPLSPKERLIVIIHNSRRRNAIVTLQREEGSKKGGGEKRGGEMRGGEKRRSGEGRRDEKWSGRVVCV